MIKIPHLSLSQSLFSQIITWSYIGNTLSKDVEHVAYTQPESALFTSSKHNFLVRYFGTIFYKLQRVIFKMYF